MKNSRVLPGLFVVICLSLLSVGALPAQTQADCFSLTLAVDGGTGSVPTALTPANCGDGLYLSGTVVTLRAEPAAGSHVHAWSGTDDDTLTSLQNSVTLTADAEVSIHYALDGDPDLPVVSGKPGGVAAAPLVTVPRGGMSPESLIGPDERVQVTDTTTDPARKIAELEIVFPLTPPGYVSLCTGTFYGPHTVITAGHCVYDSVEGGWALGMYVTPGQNGETTYPYGYEWATSFQSVSGWVDSGLPEHDYGVIQLPDNLLGNQVGSIQYGYYSDAYLQGRAATVAGYPGDKPYGTQWKDSDPISTVEAGLLYYGIDTTGGESGSPLYITPSGSPIAVAIHAYGECVTGVSNCGPRITPSVAATIQSWGAASGPQTDCPLITTPANVAPTPGQNTNDTTPYLDWTDVASSSGYQVNLYNADYSTKLVDVAAPDSSYTVSTVLADGIYHWRVMANTSGSAGCPDGAWSAYWDFTVDTVAPSVPVLASPADGSTSLDTLPNFDWGDSTGSPTSYELLVDAHSDFLSLNIDASPSASNFTPSTLASGRYWWKVRALDAAGNASSFSAPWSVRYLKSVEVTHSLSGNTGAGSATLSYDTGVPETATSGAGGDYSLNVPDGWSGTVTVSKPGYFFTPNHKDYENTTADLTGENYTGYRRTAADFDALGTTDLSVYRPSTRGWFVRNQFGLVFGLSGDIPVPGDYDGNGSADVAVFRPSDASWYVRNQASGFFGLPGDVPVPGDYDGNGTTDWAVYRPSTSAWYIKNQSATIFGLPGDIPVPADYNGDGTVDIAVYRPSTRGWFIRGQFSTIFGLADDIPVPGDYDGNGSADVAVFRPSTNGWFVRSVTSAIYGAAGDIPVPGDYNADGITDIAVYRPSNSGWFVRGQSATIYGTTGDYPLPAPDTNADGDPYQ